MILNSPYISGSLTVTGNITAQGGINISGSIASASYAVSASEASKLQGLSSASFAPASTFNTVSQSYAASSASLSTRVTTNETNISTLTSASASFAVVSSSYAAASGSLSTRVTNLEATSSTVSQSFASTSGSISGRVTLIEGQYATTGSNNFTGPQFVNQASNAISFTSTASLYTDGGLRVAKDSFVSGTAYFNNITVYGTSSIQYITSSQVNIGSNIITVNTDTPAIRFGGLSVFDSGSTQLTGSLFWDSENNHWIYSNPSGSSYNSAMLMNGPRNTGSLGNEQGTTNNALMKGQGGDHITSSQMFDDGTTVRIPGALQVTGSIVTGGILTGSSAIFASTAYSNLIVDGTNSSGWGNNIAFRSQGTDFGYVGSLGSLLGSTTKDMTVWATSGNGFRVYTNGNNKQLEITSAGAATFSNSVTAGNGFVATGYPAASGNGLFIAYNSAGSNTGSLYSYNYSTSTYNPTIIDGSNVYIYNSGVVKMAVVGGNVGIGTTSPTTALEVSSADLNNIFVTNPTTTGTTTGSGIGFKAYNGTSVAQSAGIILTSNTWSYGTYSANQLSVGSDGTGGLALRTANSAPISFFTGGATAGLSTLRLTIASTGAATFSSSVTAPQFIAQESNSASSTQIQIVNTSSASNTTKTSQLLFRLADTVGTIKSAAYIRAIPEGVNVLSAALSFATRSGDSDPVERLSIASSGAATFSSSVAASTSVTVTNSGAQAAILSAVSAFADGYRATLRLWNQHTGGKAWEVYSTNNSDGAYSGGKLVFVNSTDSVTTMTLTSAGNVGIGTSSPSGGISGTETALEISNSNVGVLALTSTAASGKKYQIYSSNDGGLFFRDATAGSQRLAITTEGNIGIGTTFVIRSYFAGSQTSGVLQIATNVAKTATANSYPTAFLGSNDATYPLGLYIGMITGASTATRQLKLQGTEIGVSPNAIVMQEDGASVLIGTRSDVGQKLRVYQPTSGNWNIKLVQPNGSNQLFQEFITTTDGDASGTARGSITYNGTNVLYNGTSDYRLKEDLKDYNGLDIVSQLKTYDFKWKEAGTRDYGMMAHELQEVLPNVVTGEKDALNEDSTIKPQGVDYSKLVPVLTKAIQEQQAQIEALKARIETLEK